MLIMKNLLFGLILVFSMSLMAQRGQNSEYWNSWRYTPNKGMVAEFEAAVAKKMKKFNTTSDTGIMTYKIVTGRNAGTYERVESMKTAKDYDTDRSAEGEYWDKNVSEFVESSSGQMRWVRIKSATRNWDAENPGTPSKFLERTTYDIKPSKRMHFMRFMDRVTQISTARGAKDTQLMFRCISGSNDNMFVVVRGWNNYGDDPRGTNSEKTWEDDYEDAFGWGSWDEDFQNYLDSIEDWGERTETMVLVPSLSTGMMN